MAFKKSRFDGQDRYSCAPKNTSAWLRTIDEHLSNGEDRSAIRVLYGRVEDLLYANTSCDFIYRLYPAREVPNSFAIGILTITNAQCQRSEARQQYFSDLSEKILAEGKDPCKVLAGLR